ncbi:hypothetical protein MIND_00887800 [Mycena indigotica]|uniref:Uncharacterized protein n=1 Tax=Mycena indigotica TaxID=2126181 RepID=A0A8H6SII2_9AGAR|nr:uncharacterized protein MIND_00887800 [Mycena indigotica]KAF7299385.1 hypothetical protein MIND_00887800 [Mycena indigotica]
MAEDHTPLYKTIAEQVAAYIDLAVTAPPVEPWRPPFTGEEDELPMEVLYDYDEVFPLPAGLDALLGTVAISDGHRQTFQQVLSDLLHLPLNGGVEYHIKELRLAYRSRKNRSLFTWDIARPTRLVANYNLLGRAEGILKDRAHPPYPLTVQDVPFLQPPVPGSNKEKPLPSYVGAHVHARLVQAKSDLDIHAPNHDLEILG